MEITINPVSLTLGVVIFIVVAGVLLLNPLIKIIIIKRTPTYWISALPAAGRVEVNGKVEGNALQTPFQKLSCVFWQLEIFEQKRGNKGSTYWDSIHLSESREPIVVNDTTGTIKVEPRHASLTSKGDELSGNQYEAELHQLGIKTEGFLGLFDKKLKIVERYIQAGEEVFVNGKIHQEGLEKTIVGEGVTPLYITNQSERATLSGLYRSLAIYAILLVVVLIIIIIVYITMMK